MKNLFAVVLSLAAVNAAFANNGVDVSVDARTTYESDKYEGDPNWYDGISADDINVTLSADLASKVRAKVRTNLAALFNGGSVGDKLEAAIEEATIEIREINGTPFAAVIFGKKQVFGNEANKDMADYRDSLLYDLFTKDQVIGLTVELNDVLGFAIAASAFENESGDLQFGSGWGFSASASRQLTENVRLRAQGMMQDAYGDLSDRRATVGLVYDSGDGRWSASIDGLYVEGVHCMNPSTNWGAQADARMKAGPGTVRVQASYLEDTAYQVAAAYDIPVAAGLVVSPTIRHTTDENGNNGATEAMIEARVRLGNNSAAVK